MRKNIKKRINKFGLWFLELAIVFSPSKILAQGMQVKYGPQMLYGVQPPAQDNIFFGIFQLAFLPFIILFVIFIGIIMLIKRMIKK